MEFSTLFVIGGTHTETSNILHYYSLLEHVLRHILKKYDAQSQIYEYYIKITLNNTTDNYYNDLLQRFPINNEDFEIIILKLIKELRLLQHDPFNILYESINQIKNIKSIESRIKSLEKCDYKTFIDFYAHAIIPQRLISFPHFNSNNNSNNNNSDNNLPVFSLTKLRNLHKNISISHKYLTQNLHYIYMPIVTTRFHFHIHLNTAIISSSSSLKVFECITFILSHIFNNASTSLYIDIFDPRLSYLSISGSDVSPKHIEAKIFDIMDILKPHNFKPFITKEIVHEFNDNTTNENSTNEDITITNILIDNKLSNDFLPITRQDIYKIFKRYFCENKIDIIYCGPKELFII